MVIIEHLLGWYCQISTLLCHIYHTVTDGLIIIFVLPPALKLAFFLSIGVPMIPHAVHVHNVSCSTLLLSWRVPNDRGSPITGYYIRYKQSASTIWSKIRISSSSTDPLQTEAKLENLLPATLYEIQINAGNEIGNSSFSEITYAWTASPG